MHACEISGGDINYMMLNYVIRSIVNRRRNVPAHRIGEYDNTLNVGIIHTHN